MELSEFIGTEHMLTNKYALLVTNVAGALLFSLSPVALAKSDAISIPMLDNAQVFAEFTDEMPAVLNYFTLATEEQVVNFYQQQFNEPTSKERKRGRLTLTYLKGEQAIRVVVSQQNNKRQVDVIVEQKK